PRSFVERKPWASKPWLVALFLGPLLPGAERTAARQTPATKIRTGACPPPGFLLMTHDRPASRSPCSVESWRSLLPDPASGAGASHDQISMTLTVLGASCGVARAVVLSLVLVGFLLRLASVHECGFSPDEAQFVWVASADSVWEVCRYVFGGSP